MTATADGDLSEEGVAQIQVQINEPALTSSNFSQTSFRAKMICEFILGPLYFKEFLLTLPVRSYFLSSRCFVNSPNYLLLRHIEPHLKM